MPQTLRTRANGAACQKRSLKLAGAALCVLFAANGAHATDIDSAFAAITSTYNAPANSTLLGVMDIVTTRPISLGGPVVLDTAGYTIGLSGVISGNGPMSIGGTGTSILSANNTYDGGTIINSGGTLQIGNGGTTGSINGDVTDNGTLVFNRSDINNWIFLGNVTGNGALVLGKGDLWIRGTNTYTGGTVIASGAQLGVMDAIAGDIVNSGSLVFQYCNCWWGTTSMKTFAGSISGSGGVVVNYEETTLTLTGDNTYTGDTVVANGTLILAGRNTSTRLYVSNAGTLQIGNGGTLGSIAGDISDGGIVTFDRSDAYTYSGKIWDIGSLRQVGTGTLVLTGANTYTGPTIIAASSTLQIGNGGTAGSIASNVTNNGTLAFNRSDSSAYAGQIAGAGKVNQIGTGTLTLNGVNTYKGRTTVSAGTLLVGDAAHPGASIASNVVIGSGGTLGGHGTVLGSISNDGKVAPGASIGTLTVGSYTQSSGATLAIEITPAANDHLRVTHAASLNGTLAVALAPGAYGTSDRTILSAADVSATFSAVTFSGADDLAQGIRYVGTTAINVVFEPWSGTEVYRALPKLAVNSAQTINDLIFSHLRTTYCRDFDSANGRPGEPTCPELSVWYQGFGSVGTMEATGNQSYNTHAAGVIGGFDYRFDSGLAFGLAASYSMGTLGLKGDAAKVSTDSYSIAVTGGAPLFDGRLDVDALYVSMAGDRHRGVTPDTGTPLTAVSHPKSSAVLGAAEYRHPVMISGLDAFARITYGRASLDAFSETEAAPFDFSVSSPGESAGFADLGMRFSRIFTLRTGSIVIPEISAAFRERFGSTGYDVTSRLADAEGASSTVPVADGNNAGFVLGLGVTAENRNGFELYLRGNGRIVGNEREGLLTFGSRYTF